MAVNKAGESKWFEFKGDETYFSNRGWVSWLKGEDFSNIGWICCQVGQSRLFQSNVNIYRVLKINRSQGSFTIERSQEIPF